MTLRHNNRAIAIREASGSGSVYMGGAHPTVWGESDLLTVYVWNQRRISAGRNLSQMSSDRRAASQQDGVLPIVLIPQWVSGVFAAEI